MNWDVTGLGDGLAPGQYKTITWANADPLSIRPPGAYLVEFE